MDQSREEVREAWQRATDADLYRASREANQYSPEIREAIRAEIQRRNLQLRDLDAGNLVTREVAWERSRLRVWLQRVRVLLVLYWVFVFVVIVGIMGESLGGGAEPSSIALAVWLLSGFLALVTFVTTYVGLYWLNVIPNDDLRRRS